jgi:hypothetical protein
LHHLVSCPSLQGKNQCRIVEEAASPGFHQADEDKCDEVQEVADETMAVDTGPLQPSPKPRKQRSKSVAPVMKCSSLQSPAGIAPLRMMKLSAVRDSPAQSAPAITNKTAKKQAFRKKASQNKGEGDIRAGSAVARVVQLANTLANGSPARVARVAQLSDTLTVGACERAIAAQAKTVCVVSLVTCTLFLLHDLLPLPSVQVVSA